MYGDGRCSCCSAPSSSSDGCTACSCRTYCSCGALVSCGCGRIFAHSSCPNVISLGVVTPITTMTITVAELREVETPW